MKTIRKVELALAAFGVAILGLTAGCEDNEPPPPPGVAVVGFVPDYCFWDGYEYVGWYGDRYYYWGPERVWVICDPVRVQRVNVWIGAHPHWRTTSKVQYHPVEVDNHPKTSPGLHVYRGHSHHDDRDHNDHDD